MPRGVHGLMRAMEQPYVGALRHQCLEFITLRLHVLPVDEQMHSLGCRRWRDRYGGSGRGGLQIRVLGRVFERLGTQCLLHRLWQVHPRLVCQLQQAKQDISDPMGYALFVGRVPYHSPRFAQRRPLEHFQQPCRLHRQRHGQVLGCVARLPITGCGKTAQPCLQR
ncbi:hypothetical protein RP29_04785 [Acidovorax temperans]|uniref:Uncharacterized protein n=1 Tax=Acidovorax temperans TaxID=80878 RepID=A0A0D7KAQ1_9BURK|nr:hypothetical protein RP29_04785 [Acidovorax temperans]